MNYQQKKTLRNVLLGALGILAALTLFVPMFNLTAKQIADQGFIYDFHKFFVDIKQNMVDNYGFYILILVFVVTLFWYYKSKR